jgi:hypothetical protein
MKLTQVHERLLKALLYDVFRICFIASQSQGGPQDSLLMTVDKNFEGFTASVPRGSNEGPLIFFREKTPSGTRRRW